MGSFGHEYDGLVSSLTIWLLGLLGGAGLLLNTVLFTILKRLWQQSSREKLGLQLVSLIAVFDTLSCVSYVLLPVAWAAWGVPQMFELPGFCSGAGFVSLFSVGMSGVLLASLGVERYLAICRQRHLSLRALLVFACAACLGQLGLLAATVAKEGLVVDATFSHCVLSSSPEFLVHYWLFNVVFLSPIVVLTFCYVAIFVKCLSLERPSEYFTSHRLSLRALLFLAVYHVCFCPKFVLSLWGIFGSRSSRPIPLHVLGAVGVALSSAINPILVLFLNKDIRTTAHAYIQRQSCEFPQEIPVLE